MGLNYEDLDPTTRPMMIAEFTDDLAKSAIYVSGRLTAAGRSAWPDLLREALAAHDDDWLASELETKGLLEAKELRQGKPVDVPVTAHWTLAQGEFNHFYIRGVCRRAVAEARVVRAYRARYSGEPRASSLAVDGTDFDPAVLLADTRARSFGSTSQGFPGPNSGMSVKLV